MGEILRFVAISFLILLILALAIPLLWLVIKMVVWLFGGMLAETLLGEGFVRMNPEEDSCIILAKKLNL